MFSGVVEVDVGSGELGVAEAKCQLHFAEPGQFNEVAVVVASRQILP